MRVATDITHDAYKDGFVEEALDVFPRWLAAEVDVVTVLELWPDALAHAARSNKIAGLESFDDVRTFLTS